MTLPARAATTVANKVLSDPKTLFIDSGEINVSTKPMIKTIAIISPIIFPIIAFDFFIASTVFFLDLNKENITKIIEMTQNTIVKISIKNLLSNLVALVYNKSILNDVTKVTNSR